MLTSNFLLACYCLVFGLITFSQIGSSSSSSAPLYYPNYDVSENCRPLDYPSRIQLTDVEGGSAVFFESPTKDKFNLEPLRECVFVVESPPGHGLILHPVTLDLTDFDGSINIYQLHLSSQTYHLIYNLNGSFDANDKHDVKSASCDILQGDQQTHLLFTFEPYQGESSWRKLNFKFLVTAYMRVIDPLEQCPDSFYFNCGSGQCIRQALHCDGIANCQDGIDEHDCSLATHEIFLIVLAIVIMLLIVGGLIWYARRKEAKELTIVHLKANEGHSKEDQVESTVV